MIAKRKHSRRICSVPQCNSVTVEGKISLKLFPKDEKLRRKWTEVCQIENKETKYLYICSLHFTDDDFKYADVRASRRVLRPDVIPSVCLPGDKTALHHKNIPQNKLSLPNKAASQSKPVTDDRVTSVNFTEKRKANDNVKSKKRKYSKYTKISKELKKVKNIHENFQHNLHPLCQDHSDQPSIDLSVYFNADTPQILQDLESPNTPLFLLNDTQGLPGQQANQFELPEPNAFNIVEDAQPLHSHQNQFSTTQDAITDQEEDIDQILEDVENICNNDVPIAQNQSLNSVDIPIYQTVPTVIQTIPIQIISAPLFKKDVGIQANVTKNHDTPIILDLIRTNVELNAFTGVLSFHMLYNIGIGVEYIEKCLSIQRPEEYMSVLNRVLLTLIKLKLNYLPFICLSVFFRVSEELCIIYFNDTVAPLRVVLDYVLRFPDSKTFYRRMPKMLEKYKKTLE